MIQFLYRVFWRSAYLVCYPVLRIKSLGSSASAKKWRERLGFGFNKPTNAVHLWAHAASVGEVKALAVALEAILAEYSDFSVTLSVMTDKGLETAEQIICAHFTNDSGESSVSARFMPLDTTVAIRRALSSAQPDFFLYTETEIWPNWLAELRAHSIPHALINARISESSFKSYKKLTSFMRKNLSGYSHILCQSETDRNRYAALGADVDSLSVCGNLKNDIAPTILSADRRREVRAQIGVTDNDFLFVCGSVRPNEESILLDLFLALAPANENLKIALAPRHDDLINITEGAARQRMLKLNRYTKEADQSAQVIIVDQFGVLAELYGASDLSFVGGTMANIGGHNLLEPPQAGRKVLFGPSVSNVAAEAAWLVKNDFGYQADDWTGLVTTVQSALDGTIDTTVSAESYQSARTEDSAVKNTMRELQPLFAKVIKSQSRV